MQYFLPLNLYLQTLKNAYDPPLKVDFQNGMFSNIYIGLFLSHCYVYVAQSPPCELKGENIVDESGLELLEGLAGELALEVLPEQILDQPRLLGGQQLLGVSLHVGDLGQDVDKLLKYKQLMM